MCRWVVRDAEAMDADDDDAVKDSATRTTSSLTHTDTVLGLHLHLQLDRSIAKHLEKGSCFFPREITIE